MPETTSLDPENVRVGATIRALRESYGLTAAELGRAVKKSEALITAIERGTRTATLPVCRAIADTLGIPLAAITVADYAQIANAS